MNTLKINFELNNGIKLGFLFLCLIGQKTKAQTDSLQIAADSVQTTVNYQVQPIIDEKYTHYFKWKSVNDNRNDSIKIFSLSPISRRVKLVNGFALGVGHYDNENIKFQKVNGLNVEASPLSVALVTIGLNVPFESIFVGINDNSVSNASFINDNEPTYIQINGLNISSGGFMGGAEMNGLNICVFSGMNKMNGLSISGAILASNKFNGLSIAVISNMVDYGNGVQIALSNVSRNHHGIQIGLFNHSRNLRGLQFGLWNTNGKRKLPFFNWQFKK